MPTNPYRQIIEDGLWRQNTALVALLGLCPLLAVSNSLVNGLGLGLATLLTLTITNLIVSLIRDLVRPEIRIPIYVLLIAAVVTAIELAMNAYLHRLYLVLGIFIPLIVTNCAVLGRAEAFASKNKPLPAALDGFMVGLGFALVLVLLGALRELIGRGTLFDGAHLLLGEWAEGLRWQVIEDYPGFLLALLPPGAFIALGLLLALKNIIDRRLAERAKQGRQPAAETRTA
jgi:electron transport complex protein RnfE